VAVRWAPGAHVVVTWRLRGSEVGPGRSRGGDVAPTWQCGWVLGAGEVTVFYGSRRIC
jgi:hypothetical protein